MDDLRDLLSRISAEEAESLLEHLSRAWRSEDLIPQPEGYIEIPVERIRVPEGPVRRDLGDLEELKGSIEREDVLQPICVRPLDEEWREFEPIIGLRRFVACRELGMESVPAYIREFGEEDAAVIALEENRHRKDLSQPELLRSMLALRERGLTVERISERAGMSKSAVSVYLRVPDLPQEVQEAFFEGRISFQHVRAMMGLEEGEQADLLRRIQEEGLSGPDAELIARMRRGKFELPDYVDGGEFDDLLGRNLDFSRGKRSVKLTVRASDEEEMAEILGGSST